jgi:uncharacterized membrane protein
VSSEEMRIHVKKGKNFKEVIAEEKNKGKLFKKTMKTLTHINSSVLYGSSFLFFFIVLDVVLYVLLLPSVFLWAGLLLVTALISSVLASKITNMLKRQQWKYAS